jgi:hypothetical protein
MTAGATGIRLARECPAMLESSSRWGASWIVLDMIETSELSGTLYRSGRVPDILTADCYDD